MFARLAVVSTLAFAALATATKCNTGPVQCCESMESANSAAGSAILAAIGATLQNTNVELGLKCSPIDVVAVGSGKACTTNTVCCKNNNIGGGVSAGCVPVTL
ncbi:fungal hydrophobin [Epithele typhae]|uniref:fungal hydrophobin n=1 Tax=Epithele typhae TaxID=378194 RepID=UPI002008A963|nr:fungal hydrophobin [Epithele typhae]KAH9910194.1 fungal hydrophobin [Epithele typhae]